MRKSWAFKFFLAFSVSFTAFPAVAKDVAKLVRISGDRQIVVGDTMPSPYTIRAVSSTGSPVSGVGVVISFPTNVDVLCPDLQDIFGFRLFGQLIGGCPGGGVPSASYLGDTDSQGFVSIVTPIPPAPSAFPIGAKATDFASPILAPSVFFTGVHLAQAPGGKNPKVVVEYFSALHQHFFNTLLEREIDLIDAGSFPDWTRSIGGFVAWATVDDAPVGTVPVCRFFSSQFTSHFYSADQGECDTVIARWPSIWTLETREAFYIYLPDKATGACGAGQQPIYRLFNNTLAPNHRYVADRVIRDVMVAAGWVAEGYGTDAVALCAPA